MLLISPIYIALLWSVTLVGNTKKYSNPRIYLGWFMLIPFVIFLSHSLYFAALTNIYPYFDIVLQCASLLVFPAYYIYFRLLTVDDKFSVKAHYRYFLIPIILTVVYAIAILFTPKIEFRTWLFNERAYPDSPNIQLLGILRFIIKLTYLIQIGLTLLGNSILIKKYGSKAEQYYSNEKDGKYNNAKMLNYSIIIMSLGAFVLTILGRQLLVSKELIICLGWSIFSLVLFIIGYMGITQKPINPTFDLVVDNLYSEPIDMTNISQKKILQKLLTEFEHNKIFLNSHLNILDVVKTIGSNRTYISTIINQRYNQNFCTFVNAYRMAELKRIFLENVDYTNEALAKYSGFGSVNSMKRAILSQSGLSLSDWKKTLIKK